MKVITDLSEILPVLVGAFLVAALGSFVLTPVIRRLATRYDVVDLPDARRVNVRPIPRGGGIAVASAFILVAVAVLVIDGGADFLRVPTSVGPGEVAALLVGGVVAALIGALDDYLDLRARWQLGGQVGLAIFAVLLGISIEFVNNPLTDGEITFPGAVAAVFTVFWIVGMINSINWIDGLDGLSSGIGLIAAATLGLISLTTAAGPAGQPIVAVLCFALAGALLGFLRWNFHPASVFAGTSGVMFVGYTLALLSILGTAKVAVALLVLGVPIIDTFWIIVRRVAARKSPFTPDRAHIHHRLLDLGLSHRQAVVLIYVICIGLAVLSFLLSGSGQLYAFMGIVLASGILLFVLARRSLVAEELSAESYPDGQAPPRGAAAAPAAGPDATGSSGPAESPVRPPPRVPSERPVGLDAPRRGDPPFRIDPARHTDASRRVDPPVRVDPPRRGDAPRRGDPQVRVDPPVRSESPVRSEPLERAEALPREQKAGIVRQD